MPQWGTMLTRFEQDFDRGGHNLFTYGKSNIRIFEYVVKHTGSIMPFPCEARVGRFNKVPRRAQTAQAQASILVPAAVAA